VQQSVYYRQNLSGILGIEKEMSEKYKIDKENIPEHIAIIMDGNGRWAKKRTLNRIKGHRAGVKSIRETIEVCREIGVKYVTLYAFSVENWVRPKEEIKALMSLLKEFLKKEVKSLNKNGIRLSSIGKISEFPKDVQEELKRAKQKTKDNRGMTLFLALNYGGRDEIIEGVKKLYKKVLEKKIEIEEISTEIFSEFLYTKGVPDPDLLIRTSGELRVSNFLLWQISYSEFYFTKTLWPDFRREHLLEAVADFQKRKRRYGGIGENNVS